MMTANEALIRMGDLARPNTAGIVSDRLNFDRLASSARSEDKVFARGHLCESALCISHSGDHTSLLAFIEKRFLSWDDREERLHLTSRDQHAHTLEDMFDFDGSPSLNTALGQALPPTGDCTP